MELFQATHYLARPWKWASWREGSQEKMLFLTETRTENPGHPSTALIGGGVFARTGEGWRLERARRAILELGSFGAAPSQDISVQGVSPRGFVAVLRSGYFNMGTAMGSLDLLSDGGGEALLMSAGFIPDTSESSGADCQGDGEDKDEEAQSASLSQCYAYDSEWKFVPHEGHALPDLVVTTAGSRPAEGEGRKVEGFHEVRTFSANGRKYELLSREPEREAAVRP
jgi:hypothetical protein